MKKAAATTTPTRTCFELNATLVSFRGPAPLGFALVFRLRCFAPIFSAMGARLASETLVSNSRRFLDFWSDPLRSSRDFASQVSLQRRRQIIQHRNVLQIARSQI